MDMIAIFNFRLMLKSEGLVKREVSGLGTTKDRTGNVRTRREGWVVNFKRTNNMKFADKRLSFFKTVDRKIT